MTTIRRLRADDHLDDLIPLSRAFFAEYERHHKDFFDVDVLRDKDITEFFSGTINSHDAATFVAVEGGAIVGYITVSVRRNAPFYKVKRYGHISALMVDRSHRRKGVAGKLLAEAAAFFRRKKVRYFTLYTAVANRAATAFYKKHGMAPLHVNMVGETGLKHKQKAR